jgi:hypothetical protein
MDPIAFHVLPDECVKESDWTNQTKWPDPTCAHFVSAQQVTPNRLDERKLLAIKRHPDDLLLT